MLALIHPGYWKLTDSVPDFPDDHSTFNLQTKQSGSIILSLWNIPKIIQSILYLSCWNCCLAYPYVLREVHTAIPACLLQSFFEFMPLAASRAPRAWGVLMCLFAGLWHLLYLLKFRTLCHLHCSWCHGGIYRGKRANIPPSLYRKPSGVNGGRIRAL